MKVFIEMTEKFAYFSIFAKTHHRFISISRNSFYKLIDNKTVFKTKKKYSKNPFSNKWEEMKPITEEEIEQVKSLISKVEAKLTEEQIKHFSSIISEEKIKTREENRKS